ncbi:hypothetical protein D3C85_717580 [compost metagenome]
MSRTVKGSKGSGYDYWSRRPFSGRGYGPAVKDFCHRTERMQEKEQILAELSGHKQDFTQEILFISKLLGINKNRIEIDGSHPVGFDVIFIDKAYNWYLDDRFYDFMLHSIDEYGDYADWLKNFQEEY